MKNSGLLGLLCIAGSGYGELLENAMESFLRTHPPAGMRTKSWTEILESEGTRGMPEEQKTLGLTRAHSIHFFSSSAIPSVRYLYMTPICMYIMGHAWYGTRTHAMIYVQSMQWVI